VSHKSRQSGSPVIATRTLFHARHRDLAPDRWDKWGELLAMLRELDELQTLSGKPPLVTPAYRFVQRVLAVHDKRHLSPEKARKRLLKAWAALPDDAKKYFPKFRTAIMERGEEYSANWIKGAPTNGITEANNRTLRDLQRAGRGLRFKEMRLRAIYSASPTERMRRAKLGLPDPIGRALALINDAGTPEEVRTVSRHGLHKRGRRTRNTSPKQLDLFRKKP